MAKLFLSTPSARRATRLCHNLAQLRGFLSTPSARRATHLSAVSRLSHPNFYPRPPRGGRPHRSTRLFSSSTISIHALREEGDQRQRLHRRRRHISIHALREEGDDGQQLVQVVRVDFYPRPPRGGRLSSWSSDLADIIFLSTPSARRATPQAVRGHGGHQISIHALREEGDDAIGERQDVKRLISIHALREEGDDAIGERQDVKRLISIHALREEGDPIQFDLHNCKDDFYPRPPRGGRLLPPHPADRA